MKGLGGRGGTICLLYESLIMLQTTANNQIGVNKIPPNFNILFAATVVAVRLFKGLTAQPLYRMLSVKRLIEVMRFTGVHS